MNKTINQKAWFFVIPVFVLVAFNAAIPLMTVVNYSFQETFGNNVITVLSGYGVGADTAARILRNMVDEEYMYKQIYEAERQYVMTRGFWDD